jgi:hypothetical protein
MNRSYLQIVIILTAVIILSLLYFFYPATNSSFHPKCPFHSLTGLYCPGCGSQRATSALLHAHFLQAINYNVLLVLSMPFILYSAFVFAWNAFSARKMQQAIFYSPLFIKTVLVTVILFWVLRNIPVAPFSWLAP